MYYSTMKRQVVCRVVKSLPLFIAAFDQCLGIYVSIYHVFVSFNESKNLDTRSCNRTIKKGIKRRLIIESEEKVLYQGY